jgi:hypothetical protein
MMGEQFISLRGADAVAARRHGGSPSRPVTAAGAVPDRWVRLHRRMWGWAPTFTAGAPHPRGHGLLHRGSEPAEPGYGVARVGHRARGGLDWAEGRVPTPHGFISVRAERARVTIDSPVPCIVELPGRDPQRFPAGRHGVEGQ